MFDCHVVVGAFCQVNMYQGGGRPAASSYKTYLTSDAAPGRPDGYSLREWKHDSSGALWSVSAVCVWSARGGLREREVLYCREMVCRTLAEVDCVGRQAAPQSRTTCCQNATALC